MKQWTHSPPRKDGERRRRLSVQGESNHRAAVNTPHASYRAQSSATRSPIFFYDRDKPYYEFTNFSPHSVWYNGKEYPTSEHLFHAHKFLDRAPHLAEQIRMQSTPKAALEEAKRFRRLQRSDWFDVNIRYMDAVLEAKFTQHPQLRDMLLSTGNGELVEASPVDSFWGYGADKRGRNELGKALMRLREKLRAQGGLMREQDSGTWRGWAAEHGGQVRDHAQRAPDVALAQERVRDVATIQPRADTPVGVSHFHEAPPVFACAGQDDCVIPERPAERRPFQSQTGSPIYFYDRHELYFEFTNFASYSVRYNGKRYPTSEHLFQAQKFFGTDPRIAEFIRKQRTPSAAQQEAMQLHNAQRKDWFNVNVVIMDNVLEAKFRQHATLRDMLLKTGNRELIEKRPVDTFWGSGADGQGRNEFGKCLMRLRDKLRAEDWINR